MARSLEPGRYRVDRLGYVHDAQTGRYVGTIRRHHPRTVGQYWMSQILTGWARRKYYPKVSARRVTRRSTRA